MYVRKVLPHGGSLAVVIPKAVCKAMGIAPPGLVAMMMNKAGRLEIWKLDLEELARGAKTKKKEA